MPSLHQLSELLGVQVGLMVPTMGLTLEKLCMSQIFRIELPQIPSSCNLPLRFVTCLAPATILQILWILQPRGRVASPHVLSPGTD